MTRHRRTTKSLAGISALCIVCICALYRMVRAESFVADTLCTCGAAGIVSAAYWWAYGRNPCVDAERRDVTTVRISIALCLSAALLMGVLTLVQDEVSIRLVYISPALVGMVLISCCATAIWEELLFRCLGFDLAYRAFEKDSRATIKAALVCSCIFALLHSSGSADGTAICNALGLVRGFQAFCFALCASALVMQRRGTAKAIAFHAGFDLICFAFGMIDYTAGSGIPSLDAIPASSILILWEHVGAAVCAGILLMLAAVLALKSLVRAGKECA